jgi:hypothetical protein
MISLNQRFYRMVSIFLLAAAGGFYLRDTSFAPHKILGRAELEVSSPVSDAKFPLAGRNLHPQPVISEEFFEARNNQDAASLLDKLRTLRNCNPDSLSLAKANLMVAAGAKSHPKEILAFLLEPESIYLRRAGMTTLFNVWVAVDKKGALKAVSETNSPSMRRDLELKLIHALAQNDPELTLDLLKNNPQITESDGSNITPILYEAFFSLGADDLNNSMARLGEIDSGINLGTALRGVASAAVLRNPGEAIDWCSSLDLVNKGLREELLSFIIQRGFLADGPKTMQELESRCNSRQLNANEILACASSSLTELVNLDFDKTFRILRIYASENPSCAKLLKESFSEFCKQNPSLAVEKLNSLRNEIGPDGIDQYSDFDNIAKMSHAQVESISSPQNFSIFLNGIDLNSSGDMSDTTQYLLHNQGEAFAEYLSHLSDEVLSQNSKNDYFESWINKDPEVAIQWIQNSLLLGQQRSSLKLHFDINMAVKNPGEYANILVKSDFSEANEQLTRIVAGLLTAESPNEAVEWAGSIRDPELFERAVNSISKDWIRRDSIAASEWIRSLPEGDAKKSAIRNLVIAIKNLDSVAAKQWADSIGEGKLLEK